jgi:hypothetical protein
MKRLLVMLMLAPSIADATKISVSQAPCPIGEGEVKIYDKIAANTAGGFDSDLASYSSQGQFRTYAISTCGENYLSLYGPDMRAPWSSADLETMQHSIDRAATDLPSGWGESPIDRYLMAAEIYRDLGKDDFFLADLYLQASWVARDLSVGVVRGLEGPGMARTMLTEGAQALEAETVPSRRKILLHNLTRIAHRGGYSEERDAYLLDFSALTLTGPEREKLRLMEEGISREAALQDLAIASLQEGLRSKGLDMETKIRSTYLLADQLRRKQRYREAFALFGLVIAEVSAPEDLRAMALFLSEDMVAAWPHLFQPTRGTGH